MGKKRQKKANHGSGHAATASLPASTVLKEPQPLWRNPVLRYVVCVCLSMCVFYALYWTESLYEIALVEPWIHVQVWLASGLLDLLQHPVSMNGQVIVSAMADHPYRLTVGQGCEAFDVTWLYFVAVAFFPVTMKARLMGALAGILLIQAINIIRIASLFLIGIYWPDQFELFHKNIWQVVLVLAVVAFWWLWLSLTLAQARRTREAR